MKPIIEVNSIWKEFSIKKPQKYLSFRDSLFSKDSWRINTKNEYFWALKDINFVVNQGESIGIIGKNGAGKSTLLKILSRITPPSKGTVIMRGRIASLLEVGTGFHPELTGRENIFFNGSILGMRRSEIKRRLDEIIDFSGIENFIDTPLKHYSSGMQMRLAFSVAAHLDAEIMLIDEVLSVGDFEFQKKCLAKFTDKEFKNNKTLISISHDLNLIQNISSKILLIECGTCFYFDSVLDGINKYLSKSYSLVKYYQQEIIRKIELKIVSGFLHIFCEYFFEKTPLIPHFGFCIYSKENIPLFASNPTIANHTESNYKWKTGKIHVKVLSPIFKSGLFRLSVWMGDGFEDFFQDLDCIEFSLGENELYNKLGVFSPKVEFVYYE